MPAAPERSVALSTTPEQPAPERSDQPFGADAHDTSQETDLSDQIRGKLFTMTADVETVGDRQQKVARFRDFEIHCDEPHWLGGDDLHPQPLTYIAAGVGFCLLTQVQRVASMLRKSVTRASCQCAFDLRQDGSVRRGDAHGEVTGFRVHIDIESPESDEDIANILRLAKQTCFADFLVTNPVPLINTFTVNGAPMSVGHTSG